MERRFFLIFEGLYLQNISSEAEVGNLPQKKRRFIVILAAIKDKFPDPNSFTGWNRTS